MPDDFFTNLRQALSENCSSELRNSHTLDFLTKVLCKKALVNSYIFAGEGSNQEKYLIAKELNKILNCSQNNNLNVYPEVLKAACGECQNCKWLEEDKHPKTPILIQLQKGKNIKIEDIKNLQQLLSQSSDFFRIIIIDPADYEYLNKHSANALLKSIEEAHPKTIFLLFAESSKNVLSTLKSRSQSLQIFKESILSIEDSSMQPPENKSSIRLVFEKYRDDEKLSAAVKNLLFNEEIKNFQREDLLKFCEELEESISLELGSTRELSSAINLIEKLELAKRDLSSYVNNRAVMDELKLFH